MASWFNDLRSGAVSKSSSPASTSISGGRGALTKWGYYDVVDYSGADGVATENYTDAPPNWAIEGKVGGSGANAYLLPWGENKICYNQLQAKHDLFLTAAMNGCGVMIAGGRASPVVVHANCYDHKSVDKLAGMEKAEKRQQIYGEFVAHLSIQGIINDDNVATWYPGSNYLGAKSGVFGARKAGGWVFYGHANQGNKATTKVIWPLDAAEDADDAGSSKCCFITSAVCQSRNLPDDCQQLQTLRWYRDTVLSQSRAGRRDIQTYYDVAPQIVARIDGQSDAAQIYQRINQYSIGPAVAAIRTGRMQLAYDIYRKMVQNLM